MEADGRVNSASENRERRLPLFEGKLAVVFLLFVEIMHVYCKIP